MAAATKQIDGRADGGCPPTNLFQRLAIHLPEYSFDENAPSFHSSYDNWHVFGRNRPHFTPRSNSDSSARACAKPPSTESLTSAHCSPSSSKSDYVVARVSKNGLRIEREFKQAQMLYSTEDEFCKKFVRPLRLVRMPAQKPCEDALVVFVIEAPSCHYLDELRYFNNCFQPTSRRHGGEKPTVPLSLFLDFAIGACACLEVLHHRYGLVHGEIRTDGFHFDQKTRTVRLINFGSGARSFVHRLTSAGWTSLLSEPGIQYKLQFFTPEQTGRLAADPDARTDIYALGVCFWTILTDRMPFEDNNPLEIIQSVISRRLKPVQVYRTDVPLAVSMIMQKMTRKTIDDRYRSVSSAKHDLEQIRRFLTAGDNDALESFEAAKEDVSCVFKLPLQLVGRVKEQNTILDVLDGAANALSAASRREPLRRSPSSSVTREQFTSSSDTLQDLQSHERFSQMVSESTASTTKGRRSYQRSEREGKSSNSRIRGRESIAVGQDETEQLQLQPAHILSICGPTGIGKSYLIHTTQFLIRQKALLASATFDRSKNHPFGPILKMIAAIFRHLFSESNVKTSLHTAIREQVGPYWESLYAHLELPVWLLDTQSNRSSLERENSKSSKKSWLDCVGASKTSRFMQILLEVLRIIASQKLVCLCLDDLDSADDESLDFVKSLAEAAIPLVLVVAFRPESANAVRLDNLTERATRLNLTPFAEDDTEQYVAHTLLRPREYCLPLAAVVHDRTGGIPANVGEFLDRCHKFGLIYFSWEHRHWDFQMQNLLQHFAEGEADRISAEAMIARSFEKLSHDLKSLICWASIIGDHFAYRLIKDINHCGVELSLQDVPLPIQDVLGGLQEGISKFIFKATDDEDLFQFANENYLLAAHILCDHYSKPEMHFAIAQALVHLERFDSASQPSTGLFSHAEHIVDSLAVICPRAQHISNYVAVLLDAAESARSTGALSKSREFLETALVLVDGEACSSQLFSLYTKAAEVLHLGGKTSRSFQLLDEAEKHVEKLSEKARAVIIRSRIGAAQGNGSASLQVIRSALVKYDLPCIPSSIGECDNLLSGALTIDPATVTPSDHGPAMLLAEALMVSFWMDELQPYQFATALVSAGRETRMSPQSAMGILFLSAIALFRLRDPTGLFSLRDIGVEMLRAPETSYQVSSRGLVLRSLLLGHLEMEGKGQISRLTHALEASASGTDKSFLVLIISTIAMLRLAACENLQVLEDFIEHSTLELTGWTERMQTGILLVCVRQFVRAMQGRTCTDFASTVLCDDEHDSEVYLSSLDIQQNDFCRVLYRGMQIIVMCLLGFHEDAVHLGRPLMSHIDDCRCSILLNAMFFHLGLSMAAVIRGGDDQYDRAELIRLTTQIRARLKLVLTSMDTKYQAWLWILEAELRDDNEALGLYDAALNILEKLQFPLHAAFCLHLYAACLKRKGAVCAAQEVAHLCAMMYHRIGAHLKSRQIETEFFAPQDDAYGIDPLDEVSESQNIEQVTPMADSLTSVSELNSLRLNSCIKATHQGYDVTTSAPNTESWLDGTTEDADLSAPRDTTNSDAIVIPGTIHDLPIGTLDVIDLHSIISSSQVMSSELNIDRLLQTLTKIIADSTGAEVCSIVIESEDDTGWIIAATQANNEHEGPTPPTPIAEMEDTIAKQLNVYVLRFRENVFVRNLQEDDRFMNMCASLCTAEDSSIICVPILHSGTLLGSLYCQSPPNTFTDRTMTVVQLLVTQISISVSNAILFKRLEKASAINSSMLELQKDALQQAREAERKAKSAETRAVENLSLKQEAMKAKSMFLANVSHELRTPLNGVIGMAEILKDTELTTQQQEYAHSISVCADTLLTIINDILDFSKLEAGKMQVVNVPLNLSQKLREVICALRLTHSKSDLETIDEIQLDPNLVVVGDPVRLQQILMNLMSNAFKFTPKGKITVSATLESQKGDEVVIKTSIRDTGIGVSDEQQKKLFLPFSQADVSTGRIYGGTGLGLSICKVIVESIMKGRIWMESTPGEGTTVSFEVPFHTADTLTTDSTSSPDPMASFCKPEEPPSRRKIANVPRGRINVCIAEDNGINRKIAINYVKKLGFTSEAFADGRQAVDALVKAKCFHLVLMDVQMPVLDGYGATREIRKHEDARIREVVIIALTASAIKGDRERCFEAGMDAYVAKPIRLQTLQETIESFIEHHEEPTREQQERQGVLHL